MSLLRGFSALLGLLLLPAASFAQEPSPTDRERDIAAFRSVFMERDISYGAEARAEAEARLAALAAATDLDDDAFEVGLARIVALADNGHSVLVAGPRSGRNRRIGVRLEPFGTSFHVLRARAEHADLLGARLVAVDGRPVDEARDAARTLFGGTPSLRDRSVSVILESPSQLRVLGISPDAQAADYTFQTVDGRLVERRLIAEDIGANRGTVRRNFYPEMRSEEEGWVAALPVDAAPWSLKDPSDPFRWRQEPAIDGLVVDLRQMLDAADQPIAAFLAEVEATIAATSPRNLVLDLRMNGGGDLTKARDFMKGLPARVPGRIFVLTSPWTFSASISSLGYLEQAAPDRVTIVGEEVGDRLMFFAEGPPAFLPASGIRLGAATQRHDYQDGCRAFTDCHHWVVRFPIAVPHLSPDIEAPWTVEDYLAGRDPGMAAVMTAVGSAGAGR